MVRLNGGSTIIPFNGLDANWQSRVMNRLCARSHPGTGASFWRFWHSRFSWIFFIIPGIQ